MSRWRDLFLELSGPSKCEKNVAEGDNGPTVSHSVHSVTPPSEQNGAAEADSGDALDINHRDSVAGAELVMIADWQERRFGAPEDQLREWERCIARLDPCCPIKDVPHAVWRKFVIDAGDFVRDWGARAAALGWDLHNIVGCDSDRPYARIDQQGIAWMLHGDRVIAIFEKYAVIETSTGARQSFQRKPAAPWQALPWLARA